MGGTKDADIERIRAAAPTHLVVNIDENRREQVDELARFVPHVIVTHPNTPEDNLELFRLFGGIFHREHEAEKLAADFRAAREELRRATGHLPRQRVLYLIWKDPWMTVAATPTSPPCSLRQDGTRCPRQSDVRYPEVDAVLQGLTFIDRVLLSTEPYRFTEKHLAEAEARFGAPAQLIDGEMVSWYGSRAAAGLRYLAQLRQTSG